MKPIRIEASAPSNIALIKYMGKTQTQSNLPTNASLSYTLEKLRSFVTIEAADCDEWQPLEGFPELELSLNGRAKFLHHFAVLKERWQIPGQHVLRSANNFPSDCGLASSASSFAALTRATALLAAQFHPQIDISDAEMSRTSRLGS